MEDIEIMKLIGSRIRSIRTAKKMTQTDLADAAEMSPSNISDIENGKTKMYVPTFVKILEALQCSADAILRPDVPEVNNLYKQEYLELLSDCTPAQMETIMKITRELKASLKQHDNDD